MTINTQTNQAEINQEYNQARETAALYIQLLEELQLRHPNLLKDFSQNIKSLLQNEVTE